MGDRVKTKYKGKICSPDAKTAGNSKDTKKWCKGVVGREHTVVTVYDTDAHRNWGLATEAWTCCSTCKKTIDNGWETPQPSHDFRTIIKHVRKSIGMSISELATALHMDVATVARVESETGGHFSVPELQKFCDALGIELRISVVPKGDRPWQSFRQTVRVNTRG